MIFCYCVRGKSIRTTSSEAGIFFTDSANSIITCFTNSSTLWSDLSTCINETSKPVWTSHDTTDSVLCVSSGLLGYNKDGTTSRMCSFEDTTLSQPFTLVPPNRLNFTVNINMSFFEIYWFYSCAVKSRLIWGYKKVKGQYVFQSLFLKMSGCTQ